MLYKVGLCAKSLALFFVISSVVIFFQLPGKHSNRILIRTVQGIMNQSIFGPVVKPNEEGINKGKPLKITQVIKASTVLNANITVKYSNVEKSSNIEKSSKIDKSSKVEKSSNVDKNRTVDKVSLIVKSSKIAKSKKRLNCPLRSKLPAFKIFDGIYPNVTVVTAYFNIGKFRKGGGPVFDTPLYRRWSQTYENLQNPLIFYTDSEEFDKMFAKVRSKHLNTTKIIRLNRTDLWSFKYLDRIKKIYSIKGYPKHHPNTVVPEYSCTQHSKHAVVEDAILKNYVTTKYVTWLDIGYFRHLPFGSKKNQSNSYWIVKPENFNDSRIAVNEVYAPNLKTKPESIFKSNIVWIGGGMAFGVPKVYLDFVQDYKHAVERYLNMSLMNTDQQVIYSMNLPEEKRILKPKVDLQIYTPDIEMNCWFYLGFSCYRKIV